MFRLFRDLCGQRDEDKLQQAIAKTSAVFQQAIDANVFSSGPCHALMIGDYLINHIDDSMTIEAQVKRYDLIVAATVAIVQAVNFGCCFDPIVPLGIRHLEEGESDCIKFDLCVWSHVERPDNGERQQMLDYVLRIGNKILIQQQWPLLNLQSRSDVMPPLRKFYCPIDSLLIHPYPNVKREPGIPLYKTPEERGFWCFRKDNYERFLEIQAELAPKLIGPAVADAYCQINSRHQAPSIGFAATR